MFSLSRESEQDLVHGILEVVERYHEARDRLKPRLTGLISAQEVMDELDIKYMMGKSRAKTVSTTTRRY